ncbi:MAG: malto-oligosyltrehalose synthase [Elusimicrobiota bacterium]
MTPASANVPAARRRPVPLSTYRFQFHKDFTFRGAEALVPYLHALGVTDLYSSPYLKAAPGSRHGYDICDHTALNPEIGSEEDYAKLTDALAERGMGHVLDFVPNHMAADPAANPWWRDVLENGPASPYARFFDVDWDPAKPELKNKILLPVLGDQYGLVLERGELQLRLEDGNFALCYFEHRFPVNPRRLPMILEAGLDALKAELPPDDPGLREFLSVLTALNNLPAIVETDPDKVAERQREKEVARERLVKLMGASPRLRRHVEEALASANGRAGDYRSFDLLHKFLESQAYRLAYWRTAGHEINYRRFFDINSLAGLRMEDEKVFAACHPLVLRMIGQGRITGLRLDHVDGLFDPAGYFARLQEAAGGGAAPQGGRGGPAFYVAVEKILSAGEALPEDWAVHGTSGYDFLNDVNGLFVQRANAERMRKIYWSFTNSLIPFPVLAYICKKLIMSTSMASELNVLANALNGLSEEDRRTRDFTLESLRDVLREVVACFPVYRTYARAEGWSEDDRRVVEAAVSAARRRNPAMEPSIFDFLRRVLLPSDNGDPAARARRLAFAGKFQQYTGPVQAKGLEDTAFYRYNVLVSLNEVGGAPERFGASVEEFHAANRRRAESRPHGMLATATHDTKRGEDARARLHVLSELPAPWSRAAARWSALNAAARAELPGGGSAPDRNDEYLFYQALVGAWPMEAARESRKPDRAPAEFTERMKAYMLKAVKEAKLRTSWVNPNQPYEEAVARFVEETLSGPRAGKFLAAFLSFWKQTAGPGAVNSLSQVLLKAASPGVCDFYQGSELWDLSLVDPDNRRPVDYSLRTRLLEELEPALAETSTENLRPALEGLLAAWPDGRAKLYLTARILRFRRERAALFLEGDYVPLAAEGDKADNIVAFARRGPGGALVAAAPRLPVSLGMASPAAAGRWGDTRLFLPEGAAGFVNVLTAEAPRVQEKNGRSWIAAADLFRNFPAALLHSAS